MKMESFILTLCLTVFAFAADSTENKLLEQFQFGHHQIKSLTFSEPKLRLNNGEALQLREGVLTTSLFDGAQEFKLKFTYYRADISGKRPLVIDLPPIIGTTTIDQQIALLLGWNGVDVILPEIQDVFTTGKSLTEFRSYMINLTASIRLLIQHISNDEKYAIDQKKIGAFGLSLGAVLSASFVGSIDEITHAYILAGGGSLHDVVTKSNQEIVLKFKNTISNNGAIKDAELSALMKDAFPFDPMNFAEQVQQKGKKIHMVMCKEDEMIPYKNQFDLWQAYGKPSSELITFYSHLGTIIRWYAKDRYNLINFIKQ